MDRTEVGIMPATKEFQRTTTQNAIITEVAKSYGDEAKTKKIPNA